MFHSSIVIQFPVEMISHLGGVFGCVLLYLVDLIRGRIDPAAAA